MRCALLIKVIHIFYRGEGQLSCSTDVLAALDAQCSGLESCMFHVRNLVDVRACRKDFTPYLEASYTCVQGEIKIN